MVQIADWQTRPMGEVCQAVQGSAFPERYQAWASWAASFLKSDGPKSPPVTPPAPPA